MKFEGTEVFGLKNALIGMRLPMSKDYEDAKSKSDSCKNGDLELGESDGKVLRNLVAGDDSAAHGQPNSKALRMVHVQVSITGPLAWWKEYDTYKVGTTANSSSTMHRIQKYPITEDCFEKNPFTGKISEAINIAKLESLRVRYNEIGEQLKDKEIVPEKAAELRKEQKSVWYDLIYGLGDSWLQTRMCDLDYSTLHSMYYWRKNHKQTCWSGKDNPDMESFCAWVRTLPYSDLITGEA